MSRFLSEIQEKYTKWAKIVKISISFNRLVFPLNFNRFSQPLTLVWYSNLTSDGPWVFFFNRCEWQDGKCDVSGAFRTNLTDLGVCFTFNHKEPFLTVNESGKLAKMVKFNFTPNCRHKDQLVSRHDCMQSKPDEKVKNNYGMRTSTIARHELY